MENMRFKVGDRVRIKSLDWYNENKDEFGNIRYKRDGSAYPVFFSKYMSNFCGEILTIKSVFNHSYHMNETSSCEFWTDEMIEGLVEEDVLLNIDDFQDDNEIIDIIDEYVHRLKDNECQINLPEGYQFKDENGNVINATKIVLEKQKKEYPKTYEECCKVLNIAVRDLDILDNMLDTTEIIYSKNLDRLLNSFRKLILCRDAYWKLYGEEMGLGKPWELSIGIPIYYIYYNRTLGTIKKDYADDIQGNVILAFQTEEMRDAFYENFKELIEQCKELL